ETFTTYDRPRLSVRPPSLVSPMTTCAPGRGCVVDCSITDPVTVPVPCASSAAGGNTARSASEIPQRSVFMPSFSCVERIGTTPAWTNEDRHTPSAPAVSDPHSLCCCSRLPPLQFRHWPG